MNEYIASLLFLVLGLLIGAFLSYKYHDQISAKADADKAWVVGEAKNLLTIAHAERDKLFGLFQRKAEPVVVVPPVPAAAALPPAPTPAAPVGP